ncbi:hypothetical protein OCS_00258 [Ophiocordyceps sinensis CO18]|uniref:Uncharacterized protein n=1 Tax=Ophiocordyceps sinensis (strain Co18 / CGMCC 3.14243) TaxID=911162 RepID=T5ANK2_OPHSC|nr:hypothetical protein OCS_00258 [Ophiocordyceps sinensis CO18]
MPRRQKGTLVVRRSNSRAVVKLSRHGTDDAASPSPVNYVSFLKRGFKHTSCWHRLLHHRQRRGQASVSWRPCPRDTWDKCPCCATTAPRTRGRSGGGPCKAVIGQDADVIARAAVRAAQLAAQGKAPSKYWVVEASEIVRLGRTEWPAAPAAAPEKPAAS